MTKFIFVSYNMASRHAFDACFDLHGSGEDAVLPFSVLGERGAIEFGPELKQVAPRLHAAVPQVGKIPR